jgi:PAS domain-containing protein
MDGSDSIIPVGVWWAVVRCLLVTRSCSIETDARTNKQYAQEILALRARVAELEASQLAHHHRDLDHVELIERLERERAQLEAITESMPDAVYIGNDKSIWRTNELGIHLLGFVDAEDLHANVA